MVQGGRLIKAEQVTSAGNWGTIALGISGVRCEAQLFSQMSKEGGVPTHQLPLLVG